MSFHRSGYQSHNESCRPKNGMLMRAQAFFHVTPEDTDQEKMKLLRMANKLQDQQKEQKDSYMSEEINRRQTTGVSYKGNYSSAHQYHSQDLHEGRFSHSLDHSRGSGRCNHGNMLHQCHKYSWIPFNISVTRHYVFVSNMKIYTGPIKRKIVALQLHNAFVKQILIFRRIGLLHRGNT
ncbi:hypothetical protein MTR_7g107300 [Medicago truncatula]|uniref:Uncharacterized protein n=1 Tax=Medicago truncatula TaxID=3880 RepID=G8A1B0_MEDTR|nr:hypothetical protein MTR_7g107300 [Medicago truncatula]